MNNEEIAKEIVQGVIHDRGCSDVVTDRAIYNSAITMAEWKDKQFAKEKQALIDKACEWLKDNYPYYFETDIEEGFVKAMKGGKE